MRIGLPAREARFVSEVVLRGLRGTTGDCVGGGLPRARHLALAAWHLPLTTASPGLHSAAGAVAQQRQPVQRRQHAVEHPRVVVLGLRAVQALGAVADAVDDVPGLAQALLHEARDQGVVLHQQDPHLRLS